MEVNFQLHAPTALTLRKRPRNPLDRTLSKPPETAQTLCGRASSWPCQDSNSEPSVVQPVASRCTDCATAAPAAGKIKLKMFNSIGHEGVVERNKKYMDNFGRSLWTLIRFMPQRIFLMTRIPDERVTEIIPWSKCYSSNTRMKHDVKTRNIDTRLVKEAVSCRCRGVGAVE
jgi:hypothetical protein